MTVASPLQLQKFKNKFKQTCLERYGVDNPAKSIEIQIKTKQTCIEKYGTEFPLQNKNIQERRQKTCQKKYGGNAPICSDKIKTKTKTTCMKRYGIPNTINIPEVRIQMRKTAEANGGLGASRKETKDKMKETCLKKYGVENPIQNTEIFEKQQKNRYKHKGYIMPSGDIRSVQGYENKALDVLLETYSEEQIQTNLKDMPFIWYNFENKKRRYYPDIFIPSKNLIIEVKSTYTYKADLEQNKAKGQACLDQGYNFKFMIF